MSREVRNGSGVSHRQALLTSVLLCVFLSSCKDYERIRSTESRSPDGQWIALVRTDQYGGPGTAGIQSTVSLRQARGRQDTIQIFELSQDAVSVDLKLSWLTASHLEISYKQPASVDFEAIKCGGIDISVREISASSNPQ
jgi:hypothetical protein